MKEQEQLKPHKGTRFLHNHPMTEEKLGVDKDHVIVDRADWVEAVNTRQEPIQADHLDRNCCNCNEYAPAIHSSMHGMCLKSERRKVVDFNSTCDKFKPIQDQLSCHCLYSYINNM
jgi:hypothetical protein